MKTTTKVIVSRSEREQLKLAKLNQSIQKAVNGNNWDKLGAISLNAKIDSCKLSKVAKTFIECSVLDDGTKLLNDKQIELLSYGNIVNFVRNSDKLKDLTLFTLNDVKLICNSILKAHDKSIKIALKVSKQGGTITQKAPTKKAPTKGTKATVKA